MLKLDTRDHAANAIGSHGVRFLMWIDRAPIAT